MRNGTLHEFVANNREEPIRSCRAKVAARSDPPPTPDEIDHGVPIFLEQLVDALRRGLSSSPEMARTATLHGNDMQRQGFTVSQVVHDYGDVCQSITELAMATSAPISADDFRILNGCLDNAIAGAVTEFGQRSHQSSDAGSVLKTAAGGSHALELRDMIQTATLAFEVIRSGIVGVGGSTGAIVQRSLTRARELVACSLAEDPVDPLPLAAKKPV